MKMGKIRLAVMFSGLMLLILFHEVLAAPQGVYKQAMHWGLSAESLDPGTNMGATTSQILLYLFHDALVKPMPSGDYTPSLAESYTISPDAKTYEFKLRRGMKFHNGDLMTAEDVAFSFWRYKSNQARFIQDKTEKLEIVDSYLVRFHFKEPFPEFLEYLIYGTSIGWVVPKKHIEKVGDAAYKKHPIGCGPYKFVEFVSGVKVIGEAFEDYWRKVPNVKRIELHIIIEASTRLAMVKRGEVDIATLMTGIFYENVKKDPGLRLLEPLSPARWCLYRASQWDPKSPWADVRVRKAASMAIDRKALADVHMPGCGPIGNIALEGDPAAIPFPPDPYDPAQARKLLAEAGYPKGFHGGTFYPYEGSYWPYGEQIATYLKAVGITFDTTLLDRPAWFAYRQGGKMKGGTFVETASYPTIGARLQYIFGAGSYGNYPDIQAIWDKYKTTVDPKIRKDLIGQVQNLIYEKRMLLPLTSLNSPTGAGPRIKGNPFKIQPLIWFTAPFEDIELQN
jgi:peptide/nickel transport system substrate-binding protein